MMKKKNIFLYLVILTILLSTACNQGNNSQSDNNNPDSSTVPTTNETHSATDSNYLNSIRSFSSNSTRAAFSSKDSNNNIIFSPISYAYSLGGISELSDGVTRIQLLSALNILADQFKSAAVQFEILNKNNSESGDNSKTMISNSLWIGEDYFNKNFEPTLGKYNFSVNTVDFTNEKTFVDMGKWFFNNSDGVLNPTFKNNPLEKALILNTTYTKSNWKYQLDVTESDIFHSSSGDEMSKYVYTTLYNSKYKQSSTYKQTSVPLDNGSKIDFVIPNSGFTIDKITSSPETLAEIISVESTNEADIVIKFPPFNVTSTFNLKNISNSLGINNIYKNTDDFKFENGLSHPLTSMIQQVSLSVDENGCNTDSLQQGEASKASMISAPERVEFYVDKPFLFLVKSKEDIPLLIGVIRDIGN